ncbi:NAD(P)H-hydrate dehydratase [Jannaschia sp. M317]|nr:NAD(P)H-hydrate dehydratase [Jannaschia sp. M317]
MRAVEAASFESGHITAARAMARAAQATIAAIEGHWPAFAAAPGRARVLCGPGNNGGDGFVVARLLVERGWSVEVFALGHTRDAAGAAGQARAACPVPILTLTQETEVPVAGCDLYVDALFGIGLTRPLEGLARIWATALAEGAQHRAAVDIPSGLCADSGRWLSAGLTGHRPPPADLTVTFHAPKLGHLLAEGPDLCGVLVVADIGVRDLSDAAIVQRVRAPDGALLDRLLRRGQGGDHKFGHGHALVLSGGVGRTGAARLSAQAALRVGAGLVTLGAPGSALMECAAQLTAVMLRRCDDGAALTDLLTDARLSAICLGPGLGLGARAEGLLEATLQSGRPLVLDADALTMIAARPSLFDGLHAGCLLTPHGGEFARLFPDLAADLQDPAVAGPAFSRIEAVQQAARRAGCTVLLKGRDTVIAGPDGAAHLHAAVGPDAAPWLATAGSGDVLAGLITGLLAMGVDGIDAARTAAWLHAAAARNFGPGLIAEDLPGAIPAVLRDLSDGNVT